MLEQLWTETLRHRPLDLALAFALSFALFGVVGTLLRADSSSPSGKRASARADGLAATAPSSAAAGLTVEQAGSLIIVPGGMPGVREAAEEGLIGGAIRTIPGPGEPTGQAQTDLANVTDLQGGALTFGLLDTEDPAQRYLCQGAGANPFDGYAKRAEQIEADYVFGVVVNLRGCPMPRKARVRDALGAFTARGIEPVIRGYRPDEAAQQPRSGSALAAAARPHLVAITAVGGGAAPALQQQSVLDARAPLGSDALVVADIDALDRNSGGSLDGDDVLRRAALAGTDLFVYTDNRNPAWQRAARLLVSWARKDADLEQRLLAAVERRDAFTGG